MAVLERYVSKAMVKVVRAMLPLLLVLGLARTGSAQNTQVIPFTSGPIPLCDTSIFTANVSGIGTLYPPGFNWWTYSLSQLTMNITSDHPQTLQITLTSPQGTDLLLSAFNGAGGQNYTNTVFMYDPWWPNITTGTAPFTGNWTAQGGGLSVFDYENADGVWTITVVDTACTNTRRWWRQCLDPRLVRWQCRWHGRVCLRLHRSAAVLGRHTIWFVHALPGRNSGPRRLLR